MEHAHIKTVTQDATEPRFAWIAQHGGPAVAWDGQYQVRGEGLSGWYALGFEGGDGKPLSISKHVDEPYGSRGLEIRPAFTPETAPGPVHWSSTLKVGKGRYVRASGYAADFPAALAECETHAAQSLEIGGLTWWKSEGDRRWITWMGAFQLTAWESDDKDAPWRFEVGGSAQTLEEAALLAMLGRSGLQGSERV